MRFVLEPWNDKAEARQYLTFADDFVATHVVIARGTEKGVKHEHHYLSDAANLGSVTQTAKLYPNWSVVVVTIPQYLAECWGRVRAV